MFRCVSDRKGCYTSLIKTHHTRDITGKLFPLLNYFTVLKCCVSLAAGESERETRSSNIPSGLYMTLQQRLYKPVSSKDAHACLVFYVSVSFFFTGCNTTIKPDTNLIVCEHAARNRVCVQVCVCVSVTVFMCVLCSAPVLYNHSHPYETTAASRSAFMCVYYHSMNQLT